MSSYFYTVGGLLIESDSKLISVPVSKKQRAADVLINQQEIEIDYLLEQDLKLSRLGLFPLVAKRGNEVVFDWQKYGRFSVKNGLEIQYDKRAKASQFFEHFLVNEVLATVFFQRGFFLMHGSAAVLPNGTAVAIIGEPGSGKSTTLGLLLKLGCKILTDEVVVVACSEARPQVLSFLPILRLWNKSAEYLGFPLDRGGKQEIDLGFAKLKESVDLKYVISLHQTADGIFEIDSEKDIDALLNLMANFSLPSSFLDKDYLSLHFEQANLIFKQVEFFTIKRNGNSFKDMEHFLNNLIAKNKHD